MKAQRRHDLQTNTLAKVITKAPSWWQQSGGKLLLGAVVVLAIVLLVRYRITSARLAEARAADDLLIARQRMDELLGTALQPLSPTQVATQRRALFSEAAGKLDDVTRDNTDPDILAEAILAKGDLNWTMATLPALPGASTSPTLQVTKDPKQLLDEAASAYRSILNTYNKNQAAVVAAHFGLAAIAENQGKWDLAEQEYKAIAALPNLPQAYLDQAKQRLDKLPSLRQPILLAMPTTAPAVAASTTQVAISSTAPATRPAPTPPLPPPPTPLGSSTTTTRAATAPAR